MTGNITRRQLLRLAFNGSIMVASSALVVGVAFPAAGLAGAPGATVLLGVRAGTRPAGAAASAGPLVVQSMDLATGQIQAVAVPQLLADGLTPVLGAQESITGWAAFADGSLVLATTPLPGSPSAGNLARLTRLTQTSAAAASLTGLARQEQVMSLVATTAGPLLGLAAKRNGTPPVRVVTTDPRTAAVVDYAALPTGQRFTTLAQCADGSLYVTAVGKDGDTHLVKLGTNETHLLTLDGVPWNNGLASLVCSLTNQLLGLGAPRYKTPNALYEIDPRTGAMTWLRDFDVAKVAVARN
jgi:hypothetical protein